MGQKKYKLVLVDDERVVIRGLRETINWKSLGIEVVADCNDGLQGLETIHELKPDIVISDIRMPKMDGLQLAEQLSKENFDGAVIIYSGYGDFDYARRAIDYGVSKYILKPIENEELEKGIREALAGLEKERSKKAALKQYAMSLPFLRENLLEKLFDTDAPEDLIGQLKDLDVHIPEKGVIIDCAVLQNNDCELNAVYNALLDSMAGFQPVGKLWVSRFAVITRLTNTAVIFNRIKELLEDMQLKSQCRISVGISNPYGEEQTFKAARTQATALREDYIFPAVNNIKTANQTVENRQRKKTVDNALKIITTDYGKKLSIKKVAESLYVSDSHLMHEFKESLGKTFNECLTEYRMIKAKEFLAEGSLRINEIAEKVGYSDFRYFGQIFKETTKMSPSEFIESIKKE